MSLSPLTDLKKSVKVDQSVEGSTAYPSPPSGEKSQIEIIKIVGTPVFIRFPVFRQMVVSQGIAHLTQNNEESNANLVE